MNFWEYLSAHGENAFWLLCVIGLSIMLSIAVARWNPFK